MPVYEFFCEPCDGIFETLRSIRESSEPAPCPVCNRDAKRIMPTSFNAFTFRDGYPRRIPDKGTFWHLGQEVKNPISGPVRPNEHPEINKPEPRRRLLKGEAAELRDRTRLETLHKMEAERERQAAIEVYEKKQATKKPTADAL